MNDLNQVYHENMMKRSDLHSFIKNAEDSTKLIENNLHRASKLIKSFKQVSVDQSIDEKRTFNIKDYLNETIIALTPNLKKANVVVEMDCSHDIKIDANPNILFQIITNLVMNSLNHAFPVDRKSIISIKGEKTENRIILQYSDNGRGMPPHILEKIFEPFFTTNRDAGGSGLGMYIVHNLVTMTLNGSISCESTKGEGTRFIISIPL